MEKENLSPGKEVLFRRAFEAYRRYSKSREYVETVFLHSRKLDGVSDLFLKLEELIARQKSLYTTNPNKLIPVDIGDETASMASMIDDAYTMHDMSKRAQAKKLARRLYSIYHPDKPTGDASAFRLIQKCVQEGDLDALYLFRTKEGVDEISEEKVREVIQKFAVREQQLQGTQSFRVAALWTANREQFILELSDMLKKRINVLEIQLLGLATKSNTEVV